MKGRSLGPQASFRKKGIASCGSMLGTGAAKHAAAAPPAPALTVTRVELFRGVTVEEISRALPPQELFSCEVSLAFLEGAGFMDSKC